MKINRCYMRKILYLLILVSVQLLFSQEKTAHFYTISGKVLDADSKNPLEYATVILKSTDTLNALEGAITNSNGQFSIDAAVGTYTISIEFMSYQTKKFNSFQLTKNTNLGTVHLELDTELLNEISIHGQNKSIEFKANKVVFNVERDISSAGSTATQILNNIPSVSVDPNGSISLRGKEDVTVMINGKTSSMSKTEALKSLPAGSIEKIELITNPGAKYKASIGGIINIILKKGKDEGLNASITTSAGYKDYYGGLITLNHKSKGVNFFTKTNYALSNPITVSNAENVYFLDHISSLFLNEDSEFKAKRNGFNSTVGADIELSRNTTITSTFNYSKLDYTNTSLTTSTFLNNQKEETAKNNRNYENLFKNEIYEFIVDFEHNFKKEGQQLTSYILLTKDIENNKNSVRNTNANFKNEVYRQGLVLKNTIYDINFINPFGEFSTVTIGAGGEFGSFPYRYNGDSNYTDINYSEDIYQSYVDYEFTKGKLYFNLGVRAEFQQSNLEYNDNSQNLQSKANDLFPSGSLSYDFNDSNSISLGLSTAIQRLIPEKIQPYEEKVSETSFYVGNEKLKPVSIKKSSLTHTFKNNNFTFSTNAFYEIYDNYWETVTYETGEKINRINKILTTPINIESLNYMGANFTSTLKVNNNLNFTGNILFLNFEEKGTYKTTDTINEEISRDFNSNSNTGSASLLTQIKIPNLFDFQTNIKHQLKSENNFYTRKAYTYANAAINKDLLNGDASIGIQVDDIFKSNIINRKKFNDTYSSHSIIENKYRTIIASFTYRFNQSKKDRKIEFDQKDIKPTY